MNNFQGENILKNLEMYTLNRVKRRLRKRKCDNATRENEQLHLSETHNRQSGRAILFLEEWTDEIRSRKVLINLLPNQ